MTRVIASMSMSLDGFIAGDDDGVGELFGWFFSGDTVTESDMPGLTFQQALNAGLVDALHIDLIPVLLGSGIRFFEQLSVAPVRLSDPVITPGTGVTHMAYEVRR